MARKISIVLSSIGISILLSATFALAQNIPFAVNLKRGSTGQDVLRLQESLKTSPVGGPQIYPEGLVTGYFGIATERAVKRFQTKYKIEPIGILGPKTRAKLNSLYAPQVSQPQPRQQQPSAIGKQSVRQTPGPLPKQQATNTAADPLVTLEKELSAAETSGSSLAPEHYDRIQRDITILENAGYPATRTRQLRERSLKLSPHLQDQKKAQEPVIPPPPPAPPQEPKLPVIKNLGVIFEPWDKTTNKAGAFLFTASEQKLFLEYGAEVPSAEGGTKILPTLEYRTAVDADVFAAIDGIATNITYQERTDDYAVHLQPEENSSWILEHDHVRNLKIAKGDTVKAGDILGKVGTLGGALGRTEIMFWYSSRDRPRTYCPFKYFDPQLRAEYEQKVARHMKDWEEFKSDTTIYAEEKHLSPGCVYETLLD